MYSGTFFNRPAWRGKAPSLRNIPCQDEGGDLSFFGIPNTARIRPSTLSILQHVDTTPRRPVLPTGSAVFPFTSPPLWYATPPVTQTGPTGRRAERLNHSLGMATFQHNYLGTTSFRHHSLSTLIPLKCPALHHIRPLPNPPFTRSTPCQSALDDNSLEGNSIEELYQGNSIEELS